jgi:tripartite-type tricarboxylate transporter receptor subunit TctC
LRSINFSVRCLLSFSVILGFANVLHAQSYPQRPIRIVVGYSAGSGTDIVARAIGLKLADVLGQSVLIDNRPGAAANIATELVAKATPDGHTLLLTANSLAISPALYRKLPYNAVEDLAPVTQVTSAPFLLVVSPALPVNSVKDLIAYIKARPGQLSFASTGNGSPDHMAGELFRYMAGLDMVHVPYKGGPAAVADVAAGRVALDFAAVSSGLPFAKSGKVKALGVTSTKRSATVPDLPTIAEAVPGYEATLWYGIFAPSGAPRDVIQKLNREINLILKLPEMQQLFVTLGTNPTGNTPAEFGAFLKSEIETYAKIVKTVGLTAD